jgi:hypothetical protein
LGAAGGPRAKKLPVENSEKVDKITQAVTKQLFRIFHFIANARSIPEAVISSMLWQSELDVENPQVIFGRID